MEVRDLPQQMTSYTVQSPYPFSTITQSSRMISVLQHRSRLRQSCSQVASNPFHICNYLTDSVTMGKD